MKFENLSSDVQEELLLLKEDVQADSAAKKIWNRFFSDRERAIFHDDYETALRLGTIGMWMAVHDCCEVRATIDIASALGLLTPVDERWIRRETGEFGELTEDDLELVISRVPLVLVEYPRSVWWRGTVIGINWEKRRSLWEYFVILCEAAKAGTYVDRFSFAGHYGAGYLKDQKHKLTAQQEFPAELASLVEATLGRHTLLLHSHELAIIESHTSHAYVMTN